MNTVLFDQECMLCRTLAAWAERRAGALLSFQSWQCYYGPEGGQPVALRILTSEGTKDDAEAWEFLLAHHPDLATIRWIAEKLGLTPQIAETIQRMSHAARRLCRNCARSPHERILK